MPRAATFPSGAIESSRSRISASAAVFFALSNFRTLSPGTKRNDLIGVQALSDSSFGLAVHQAGAAAACDHLAMLIGRGVFEFDDALGRPRFAGALGNDFGMRLERVAVKHRFRKLDVGHAEIADGGAERGVVHAHPDHDSQ